MKNNKNYFFLVEIGVEDIPYKHLENISKCFLKNININLIEEGFSFKKINLFYTIRRISILVINLSRNNKNIYKINKGPNIDISFNKNNEYTDIFYKWINKFCINTKSIKYLITNDGIWLISFTKKIKYNNLSINKELLNLIKKSIIDLNISGIKIYNDYEFIRPIIYITIILNDKYIKGNIIGIKTSNFIFGNIHNFDKKIYIKNYKEYFLLLKNVGKVIINIKQRKKLIKLNINKITNKNNLYIKNINNFINFFSYLSEWPSILKFKFNIKFLNIPNDILLYFIKDYFKYIPTFNTYNNKLTNEFIVISNISFNNCNNIIFWNELKINNLLNQVYFLFNLDKNKRLINYLFDFKKIIFRNKFGNFYEKIIRVKKISLFIFKLIRKKNFYINKLIYLYKIDLVTNLGKEFNKLHGILGMIYSLNNGENYKICLSIKQQYFNELNLNLNKIDLLTCILTLSDKLDTFIVNFLYKSLYEYNILEDSDLFFMRRYILNIIKILIYFKININIFYVIKNIFILYNIKKSSNILFIKIKKFILNKLINIYLNNNYSINLIKSVLFYQNNFFYDFNLRIKSIKNFMKHKNKINNIIVTYKRIENLLDIKNNNFIYVENYLNFKILYSFNFIKKINLIELLLNKAFINKEYLKYLHLLNELSKEINNYLDNIYILVENNVIRKYRLNFLNKCKSNFEKIININLLQNKF